MKRSIRTALATTAALGLTAFGAAAPASAGEKPKLTKEPQPWVHINEHYTFPAGYACKDEVKVHEKAKFRDILYKDKHGKVVKVYSEFADWSTVKFSATTVKKHHDKKKVVTKSIKLNEGGDAWIYNLKGDFDVNKVKAWGANWGQGSGIYGIPWTYGPISYVVVNANDPEKYRITHVDFSHVKKYKQVCYKIGSKPVWGKNVLPEGDQTATPTANGISADAFKSGR